MSYQYRYPSPDYLRALVVRDPVGARLYIRSLRSERIRAAISAFARSAWRHAKQQFEASQRPKPVEPPFYASLRRHQQPRMGANDK